MKSWPLIKELLDLVHEAIATRLGTRQTVNEINARAAPLLQLASQRVIMLFTYEIQGKSC